MKIVTKLSLAVIIFMATVFYNKTYAQCSEAENATMKKYAELTRTGDAQGCSQCAWLANLYCIAENGLYKNDKTEVQNAINATKTNIKLMGEPICCPELLTKSVKWGQPKTDNGQNDAGTVVEQNKTVQDIQEVIQYGVDHIDNITQTRDNHKDIKKTTDVIEHNSTLLGTKYSSKQEIEEEYQYKLKNIENTTDMFVKSRVKNAELGVERGKMSNDNITVMASNLFGGLETALAESDAKKLIEYKKEKLAQQKKYLDSQFDIIEQIKKDKAIILDKEILQKTLAKTGNDYSAFNNYTIVQGWNPTIKIKDFKKIIKKNNFTLNNRDQHYKGLYGAYSLWNFEDLRFELYYDNLTHKEGLLVKKGYNSKAPYKYDEYRTNNSTLRVGHGKNDEIVVQVVKTSIGKVEKEFSIIKFKEFQNELLTRIEDFSKQFNIPAEYVNVNIATLDPFASVSFQMITTVVWTDKNQKAFALVGDITVQQGSLVLIIREGDLSFSNAQVLKDLKGFTNLNQEMILFTN